MKKLRVILGLILITTLIFLSGCSNKEVKTEKPATPTQEMKKKIVVYTTFFPVHDFAKRIIGDKVEIRNIIDWTAPPHGFELNASQIAEISKADLIIYNGANMEEFIKDLKDVVKDESKFLDLSQGLTLLTSGTNKSDQENKDNVNPHTWLSIRNAMTQLDTIYRKISSLDPKNQAEYKKNLESSTKEFKQLDERFEQELNKVAKREKYFIVSHAAFNYLANDYKLKQVAVTGVSPEDEPSAKNLRDIADFVKKHKISTIFFEGKATPKVAKTLARETKTKTSVLYTMEALNMDEAKLGYLELMKRNLDNLVASFNE